MIQSFKDLKVYQESYALALVINKAIFAKRLSEKEFKRYLLSAIGSSNEMVVHISFAKDLGFWKPEFCEDLLKRYDILGKQFTKLLQNWKSYPTSKI